MFLFESLPNDDDVGDVPSTPTQKRAKLQHSHHRSSIFVIGVVVMTGILIVSCCAVLWSTTVDSSPPLLSNLDHRASTRMTELLWSNHTQGPDDSSTTISMATLEFCQTSAWKYGYRSPSDDVQECGPILFRLRPGHLYHLRLRNTVPAATTRLHIHGYHGLVHEPVVEFGECAVYRISVPSDHMGGTFWLHSHHNGSEQVNGGAYGMVIIEENPEFWQQLDAPRRLWLQQERFLLMSHTTGGRVLANGQSDLELQAVKVDYWYRLRIVAVDPTAARHTLVLPDSCEARAVAYDGIWRHRVPHDISSSVYTLSGASRLDVALRCSKPGRFPILFANTTVAHLPVIVEPIVAKSAMQGSPYAKSPDESTQQWSPVRPWYLQDLTTASEVYNFSVRALKSAVNGVPMDPQHPLLTVQYDSIQEWEIYETHWHPFHLHTFPMQIVGGRCTGHEIGEFYSVVVSSSDRKDQPCRVRFRVTANGMLNDTHVMFHCHVLRHSEEGSMAWMRVVARTSNSSIAATSALNKEPLICPE